MAGLLLSTERVPAFGTQCDGASVRVAMTRGAFPEKKVTFFPAFLTAVLYVTYLMILMNVFAVAEFVLPPTNALGRGITSVLKQDPPKQPCPSPSRP